LQDVDLPMDATGREVRHASSKNPRAREEREREISAPLVVQQKGGGWKSP
jgi:hypothetical protein